MNERENAIVDAALAHTFSALQEGVIFPERRLLVSYEAACCVAASRIMMDVLKTHFIYARPMKVQTVVMSPAHRAWQDAGAPGEPPKDAHAATCGMRDDHRMDMLNGHVVLIVEKEVLADPSAQQFDRPAHGMPVPGPLGISLADEEGEQWLRDPSAWLSVALYNGGSLSYRQHPDLSGLFDAPAWDALQIDHAVLVERINSRIDAALTGVAA